MAIKAASFKGDPPIRAASIENDRYPSTPKWLLFVADPLLHTVALDHAPGLVFNEQALVENVVGSALLRRYEPPERLIETFILPERLHIWQTARGGELDFVCGPRLGAR
jgi:predicted AAA+ superfamily ATPase